MTKQDIYSIVVKILGLYFLTKFIQHFMELGFMIARYKSYGESPDILIIFGGIFVTTVISFVLGYFLTFKSESITKRIFKFDSKTIDIGLEKTDWIEISLVTIGIIAIVFSVPQILSTIVDNIYFHNHRESVFWTLNRKTDTLYGLFKLLAGLFLILNARNFAKKIVRRGENDDELDEKS